MSLLIDTNVLIRLADDRSSEQPVAVAAIEHLLARNIAVFISGQVLVELWVVATRPEDVNGLGWTTAATVEAIRALQEQFPLLVETPDIVDRWLELVARCQVSGKRAHDARLAALAIASGVERLLTFNTADFPPSWGVKAEHPEAFASAINH